MRKNALGDNSPFSSEIPRFDHPPTPGARSARPTTPAAHSAGGPMSFLGQLHGSVPRSQHAGLFTGAFAPVTEAVGRYGGLPALMGMSEFLSGSDNLRRAITPTQDTQTQRSPSSNQPTPAAPASQQTPAAPPESSHNGWDSYLPWRWNAPSATPGNQPPAPSAPESPTQPSPSPQGQPAAPQRAAEAPYTVGADQNRDSRIRAIVAANFGHRPEEIDDATLQRAYTQEERNRGATPWSHGFDLAQNTGVQLGGGWAARTAGRGAARAVPGAASNLVRRSSGGPVGLVTQALGNQALDWWAPNSWRGTWYGNAMGLDPVMATTATSRGNQLDAHSDYLRNADYERAGGNGSPARWSGNNPAFHPNPAAHPWGYYSPLQPIAQEAGVVLSHEGQALDAALHPIDTWNASFGNYNQARAVERQRDAQVQARSQTVHGQELANLQSQQASGATLTPTQRVNQAQLRAVQAAREHFARIGRPFTADVEQTARQTGYRRAIDELRAAGTPNLPPGR